MANAAPPPPRNVVAVVIGTNTGAGDEEPLRFAASDAKRMRDVLRDLGDVRPEDIVGAGAESAEGVLGAVNRARERVAALSGAGKPTLFVFYFSGHGDDEALHLAHGNVPLRDLRAAIGNVAADLRITILDACRTTGRAKGVTASGEFSVAVNPDAPRGAVELRASAVGEAAQESDELGGAVFTHFLVSGLRGAADGDHDGRVTLAELYSFVYRSTLMRTTSAPVLQHPSMQMALGGAGDVILTVPSTATAFIEVPASGGDRYFVFARPSDAALGEINAQSNARLAVPPGKYMVVRRSSNATAVASVDLSGGGSKTLGLDDFRAVAREALARRGGALDLDPFRVEARGGSEWTPGQPDDIAGRVGLALTWMLGHLELDGEVAYAGGRFASPTFSGGVSALAIDAAVGYRFDTGRVAFTPFVGVEARNVWQHFTRVDPARIDAAGFDARETRSVFGAGPRLGARAALALGAGLDVSLGVSATGLLRREVATEADPQTPTRTGEVDRAAFHPTLAANLGLGYAF